MNKYSYEKYFQLTNQVNCEAGATLVNVNKLDRDMSAHNIRAQKRCQNASNCNRLEDTAVSKFWIQNGLSFDWRMHVQYSTVLNLVEK